MPANEHFSIGTVVALNERRINKGGFLRVKIYLGVNPFCTKVSSVHLSREAMQEGTAAEAGAVLIQLLGNSNGEVSGQS